MTRIPDCSIVIPTYNGRALLETCLESIERHRPKDLEIEVIVSDDASTDDTADWLTRSYPRVRLLRRESNGGFCASANAGIAAARGRVIQLLNNDTEVTEGWIETGLAHFADPRVGSVAPLVLFRRDPSLVDSAGDSYSVIGWPSKRGHGRDASRWLNRPAGPVFGASGSSAFYRAEVLKRIGGYNAAFGSYYEDIELAFRLRWAGYTCIHEPRCRILHDVSASYDHGRPDLQRRMARNAERIFWTCLPARWLAFGLVPHLGFTFAQAGWRLLRGRLRPFLAGKVDAWSEFREWPARRRHLKHLAHEGVSRPHFPLVTLPLVEAVEHLRRPGETKSVAGRAVRS